MKILRPLTIGLLSLSIAISLFIGYSDHSMKQTIQGFEQRIISSAKSFSLPDATEIQALPQPVQRYFAFTFPNGFPEQKQYVVVKMQGMFRRPLTQSFEPTTARQVASFTRPDMVFSASTPIFGPIWADVYDRFIEGEMQMEAKLLSAFSVVHEDKNPSLNQISLRRWLLESPTYPMALLPGGIVTWHAIDDTHALAVASAYGIKAELMATFGPNGELLSFDATKPGDLTTPYHGSGERVSRSDFQLVNNIRLPMSFEISRVGKDAIAHPFWRAKITDIHFAP